jgi:hypothetical protein
MGKKCGISKRKIAKVARGDDAYQLPISVPSAKISGKKVLLYSALSASSAVNRFFWAQRKSNCHIPITNQRSSAFISENQRHKVLLYSALSASSAVNRFFWGTKKIKIAIYQLPISVHQRKSAAKRFCFFLRPLR